jgi:hypothetical protein
MEKQNITELETMTVYVVDADDLMEDSNGLHILYSIKAKVPNFKITLFTILGKCSDNFIEEIKKIDWIDMVPHGWMHETSRECEHWTYEESIEYLNKIEKYNLTKGFKAPGWQISDGMYKALLEKGYWVADQIYNNERRPKGLRAYLIDSDNKIHCHIPEVCGNGLLHMKPIIVSLKGNFKFIKDIDI